MRLALITDVHGNREGFSAVLADVAARGADAVALLGDIVGYGPDPEWCVDKAAELVAGGAICLKGNHDAAIAEGGAAMNGNARRAIDWTRGRLSAAQADFLAGLPMQATWEGAALVHASTESPGDWIYVTSEIKATGALRSSKARVVFCGHVHVPALYSADLTGAVREQRVKTGVALPLLTSRRWLAVVGSAGQPRDRNPAAGWALYDAARGEVTFRKVAYDCGRTAMKVRAAGLPEALALRLLSGD